MKRFLWIHGPAILWAMLIFILSSLPSLKPPNLGFSMQDKLSHLIEYGIFGVFLQRSFTSLYGNSLKSYLLAFLVGTAYAGLDEVHQTFVEGRSADFGDYCADTVGIVLSQLVFWRFKRV